MAIPRRLSVPIHLDRGLSLPLQDQLAEHLRRAIGAGQLAAGVRMPSTRTLAAVLRISRGIAINAYDVLIADGHLTSRHGSGTYVAIGDRPPHPPETAAPSPVIDMSPDQPSPQDFPLAAWRAAWRRAGHRPPPIAGLPALGLPELREAVLAHLRDSRGLVLDGHEVVITSSCGQAIGALLLALGRPDPVIGVEDPMSPASRAAFGRHTATHPIPIDADGARVDLIPETCDVVSVRPERNAPLGTRMSMERRLALASWAAARGALVTEPGFDGLFDPHVNPLPSLLAVGDPECTAMVGTFGAVLTPTLPLAYLVVPRRLAGALRRAGLEQPSLPCQQALAELLASGCVARRIDRLSSIYAAKRALVRSALADYAMCAAHVGSAVTLTLPDRVRAASVVRALRERRVRVADLRDYYHRLGCPANGVVIGHGHLDDLTLRRALRVVVTTLREYGLADASGQAVQSC